MGKIMIDGVPYSGTFDKSENVLYNNSSSGLSATNVQEGIDELNTKLSHVGMIIHTTTLDTMDKVIAIYGGTKWEKIEGMFLLGQSANYEVNTTGGEASHTLTTGEMPSHTHTYYKPNSATNTHTLTVSQIPSHTHTYGYPISVSHSAYGNEPNAYGAVMAGGTQTFTSSGTGGGQGHSHGITTTSTNTSSQGSSSAHNNMPPYKTVYIWERTE